MVASYNNGIQYPNDVITNLAQDLCTKHALT